MEPEAHPGLLRQVHTGHRRQDLRGPASRSQLWPHEAGVHSPHQVISLGWIRRTKKTEVDCQYLKNRGCHNLFLLKSACLGLFGKIYLFVSHLQPQPGTQTRNPKIKNCTLCRLRRPPTALVSLEKLEAQATRSLCPPWQELSRDHPPGDGVHSTQPHICSFMFSVCPW